MTNESGRIVSKPKKAGKKKAAKKAVRKAPRKKPLSMEVGKVYVTAKGCRARVTKDDESIFWPLTVLWLSGRFKGASYFQPRDGRFWNGQTEWDLVAEYKPKAKK